MSRVCIFLADGFEEVEALTVVDLLRRAEIKIDMVSISDTLQVRGRSNIEVTADLMWDDAKPELSDMLILPGGMPGVTYLGEHKGLTDLIKEYAGIDFAAITTDEEASRQSAQHRQFSDSSGFSRGRKRPAIRDSKISCSAQMSSQMSAS